MLTLAGLACAVFVWRTWDRVWDVASPDLHASNDPSAIARGEYLALGPGHCTECHLGREATALDGAVPPLSGGRPFSLGPLGTLYAANLTPDPATGLGRFSDPAVARLLRHGVRPDGRASIPLLMPYGDMSDEDVIGVLSYLRSLPPVTRTVPANEWTLLGKVMKSFVAAAQPRLEVAPPRTSPPQAATVERGAYLARSLANCAGCHTTYDDLTGAATGPAFAGGNQMEPTPVEHADSSRLFRPPNITPLAGSALMKFPDRDTFVARFTVGGRRYEGSPMPWEAFSRMTREDLGALYEFLLTVPPAGTPAPDDPTVPR